MTKQTSSNNEQLDGVAKFRTLNDYIATVARGRIRKGQEFSLCIRASLSKCYEFNLLVWDESKSDGSFFLLPTLRGICEEIIVLNYVQGIPKSERDILFSKLMLHEVHTQLATQAAFFSATRPMQPILRPQMSQSKIQSLEDEIRSIWRANGWPKMNHGVVPPVRQIAEKHGGDILAKLYDYLYRLTSNTVHFSIKALLRTGWGDIPNCTFSIRHFNGYYIKFSQIYGAFLFCVYFELFSRFLRPDIIVQPKIDDIRNLILSHVRWPEMVTFEEMNIPVPDLGPIINALSVVLAQESKSLLVH